MAVEVAARIGVIIRKTTRSCALAEELATENRDFYGPTYADATLVEDAHLLSLTIAPRRSGAAKAIARLSGLSLHEGVDFVMTERAGVQGTLPNWLSESRGDTDNPPELLAKMPADVRQMWLDRAPKVYSLVMEGAS